MPSSRIQLHEESAQLLHALLELLPLLRDELLAIRQARRHRALHEDAREDVEERLRHSGLSALGAGGEDEEEGVAEEDGGVEVAHLHQRLVVGGPVVATRDGLIEREHGVTHGTEIGHHQGERAFDVGVLHLDGH